MHLHFRVFLTKQGQQEYLPNRERIHECMVTASNRACTHAFAVSIVNQTFSEDPLCAVGNKCKETDVSKHEPHGARGVAWSQRRGKACPA